MADGLSNAVPPRIWQDGVEYIRADLKHMARPVHPTTEDVVLLNGWTLCAVCPVRQHADRTPHSEHETFHAGCEECWSRAIDVPYSFEPMREMTPEERASTDKVRQDFYKLVRGRPDTAEGERLTEEQVAECCAKVCESRAVSQQTREAANEAVKCAMAIRSGWRQEIGRAALRVGGAQSDDFDASLEVSGRTSRAIIAKATLDEERPDVAHRDCLCAHCRNARAAENSVASDTAEGGPHEDAYIAAQKMADEMGVNIRSRSRLECIVDAAFKAQASRAALRVGGAQRDNG